MICPVCGDWIELAYDDGAGDYGDEISTHYFCHKCGWEGDDSEDAQPTIPDPEADLSQYTADQLRMAWLASAGLRGFDL